MSNDRSNNEVEDFQTLQKQVWALRGENTALVLALQVLTIVLEQKNSTIRSDFKESLAAVIDRLHKDREMAEESVFIQVMAGRRLLSELIETDPEPDGPDASKPKLSLLKGGKDAPR